jgi:hypothetical protein
VAVVRIPWPWLPLCCGAVIIAAACDTTGPLPDYDETPSVALLITPEPVSRFIGDAADSGLRATIVTTGTPVRSPYLRADRFEMRRLADGARFAWRYVEPPQDAVGVVFSLISGNYFLPRRADPTGLGSDSITPGTVYELVAEAGPHRVEGRTRVPAAVEFVRAPTDGDSIVRWRHSAGAATYSFELWGFVQALRLIDDTTLVVRVSPFLSPESPPTVIRVFALDSNYAAFRSDFRVGRAGINGGWGVFGSFTWSDTDLRPSAATATPR